MSDAAPDQEREPFVSNERTIRERLSAAAVRTLEHLRYTYLDGAAQWKPPLGKRPDFDTIDCLRANLSSALDEITRLREDLTIATSTDPALEALRRLSDQATPGRWEWHTSNSWLRLGTDARGNDQNGVPYGQDGYVAYPFISRGDRHPDLCIRNQADQELIVAAVNYLRDELAKAAHPSATRNKGD